MAFTLRLSILAAFFVVMPPGVDRAYAQQDSVEVNLDVLDRYRAPPAGPAPTRRRLPLPPGLSDEPDPTNTSTRRRAVPPPPPSPKPATEDPTRLTPAQTEAAGKTPPRQRVIESRIPEPVVPMAAEPEPEIPSASIEPIPMPDVSPPPERPRAVVTPPAPGDVPAPQPAGSANSAPAQTARLAPADRTAPATAGGGPGRLRVLFGPAESAIGDAAASKLDSAADWLARHPEGRLQIVAYAAGESRSRARQLSFQRGLAVRSWLLRNGVSDTRIDVSVKGREAGSGPPDRVDIRLEDR